MARLIGVDVASKVLIVQFDYMDDLGKVMDFIKTKLGDDVTVEELSTFIEELQAVID